MDGAIKTCGIGVEGGKVITADPTPDKGRRRERWAEGEENGERDEKRGKQKRQLEKRRRG